MPELNIPPKLVQYIKLEVTQTGISTEYVRASRLGWANAAIATSPKLGLPSVANSSIAG